MFLAVITYNVVYNSIQNYSKDNYYLKRFIETSKTIFS